MNYIQRQEVLIAVFYIVSAIVLILGVIFRINHWNAAKSLLIIGMILQIVAFAFDIYKTKTGKRESR